MSQTFNATRGLSSDINLTESLSFFGEKLLQNINTITLATVISADSVKKRLIVKPLINGVDSAYRPITPPTLYDIPYGAIRGGSAGIITEFSPGDNVIVGFCQRQIDVTKETGDQSTPSLYRYFSLQDAIILSHWSNNNPTIFIKIVESGITIQSNSTPITINTTDSCTINSNSATIASNTILLNGDVTVTGNLTIGSTTFSSSGDTTIDGKVFLTHTHGGVQTGSSNTGPIS